MRTITHLAVKKFMSMENFSRGNTQVFNGDEVKLCLHGNNIATIKDNGLFITNCGWFSNTTKERLNGLLGSLGRIGIQQRNFKWYLDEKEWDGSLVKLLPNNDWEYV